MQHVPGDPARVTDEARLMLTTADAMRDAAAQLRELANRQEFASDAVDAFQANAQQLETVMTDSEHRYRATANALLAYAPALEAAQQTVNAAIGAAGSTHLAHAQQVEHDTRIKLLNPLLSPTQRDELTAEHAHAKAYLAEQQAQLARAQEHYATAVATLDAAAKAAMQAIQDAVQASKLNDTFWDKLEHFKETVVDTVLEAIADAIKKVNEILGLVALALCWVPVLGEILLTASLVLTGLQLAVEVLEFALGDITFGQLVAGAIELALAVVLKHVDFLKTSRTIFQEESLTVTAIADESGVLVDIRYLVVKVTEEDPFWTKSAKEIFNDGARKVIEKVVGGGVEDAVDSMIKPDSSTSHALRDAVGNEVSIGLRGVPGGAPIASGFDMLRHADQHVSHDVDQLHPDFSKIDMQQILSHFSPPSITTPSYATAGSSGSATPAVAGSVA